MGLFDKFAGEFIDIIEWTDKEANLLVHRFNRYQNEIKYGAKLIVRPGQKAVFVREGKLADTFTDGTYTLETKNLPLLSTLAGWKHGFNSPIKAEVYFIDITEKLDRKWGTPNPVLLRDPDFGMVRLRCRGNYTYKITSDQEMISRFVGAGEEFYADELEDQIRTRIISSFSDSLAELKIPTLDLPAKYNEISEKMEQNLTQVFIQLGLELKSFTLENISLPEAVEKAIDERAAIAATGNLNEFTQYSQAKAMRDAAQNENGVGQMMGMMIGGQLGNQAGVTSHQETKIACANCGHHNPFGSKFCGECGNKIQIDLTTCHNCEKEISQDAKFCPNCGAGQSNNCKNCQTELQAGAKFCPECGTKQ